MHDDTSPTLRTLFDACLDVPAPQRAGFLETHCPDPALRERITRLLHADQCADALFDGGAQAVARAIGETGLEARLPAGSRVGPFEIVRMLGEGGSATVFLAQRDSDGVRQHVALKILSRGLYSTDAQRQFRRERTALTQLTHPGIARLIEGGVTDTGVAYIALELVDGVPITQHARERALDPRERLLLFVHVCRAVEAAHRALIVHRDLKPSNVFVTTDGNVKLLDFGIAKLLHADDEDNTRAPMLTPAYAAPEQRSGGPITTATDVYALGVLLGELVTGRRIQHDDATTRPPPARITAQAEALPYTAAQLRRTLNGDLDNILRKSLDASPERRYTSAGAFADDIGRLLDGKPVHAHPPSRWYRLRKFTQRHRGGVAFAALFVVAILSALGVALWQARVARQEWRRADAMRDFMVGAFVEAEPGSPRDGPPRITEVAEKAIALARDDAAMDPRVRTELLGQLGLMLRHQGHLQQARDTLQWNYDRARANFGDDARLTRVAGYQLAQTMEATGEFEAARVLDDRLLATTQETDVRRDLLLVSSVLATKRHDAAHGLSDAMQAVQLARQENDTTHLAEALSYLSNAQLAANDLHGAVTTGEEQLALRIRQFGERHVHVSTAHATLSRAYRRVHDVDAAERHILAALDIDKAVLPPNDWRYSRHLNALMALRLEQRDFRAALDAAQQGLAIDRIAYGEDHVEVANDLAAVGAIELLLEDYAAALPPLRELIDRTNGKAATGRADTSSPSINYGVALARSSDYAAGVAELQRVVAALETASPPDPAQQVEAYLKFSELQIDTDHASAALPLLDKLDASLVNAPDAADAEHATTLRARAWLRLDRVSDAASLLDRAVAAKPGGFVDATARAEMPLLRAEAAARSNDARAESFITAGLAQFALLRNPPNRLTLLANRLKQMQIGVR